MIKPRWIHKFLIFVIVLRMRDQNGCGDVTFVSTFKCRINRRLYRTKTALCPVSICLIIINVINPCTMSDLTWMRWILGLYLLAHAEGWRAGRPILQLVPPSHALPAVGTDNPPRQSSLRQIPPLCHISVPVDGDSDLDLKLLVYKVSNTSNMHCRFGLTVQ